MSDLCSCQLTFLGVFRFTEVNSTYLSLFYYAVVIFKVAIKRDAGQEKQVVAWIKVQKK